jgi:hypothetical protein
MKNATEVGFNRSGMATAPRLAPQALEARALTPKTSGDASLIAKERIVYAKASEPLATMPPPGTLKELATTTLKLLKGEKAVVFSDKVGERLAFERAGARLYEALLSKHDAFGTWERGPSRADLEDILREELEHFHLLVEVLEALGSDPTAVTPSAGVQDVAATGVRALLVDPRVDLRQSLEAILVAELVDNECWQNLVRLAAGYGEHPLAARFQRCLEQERVHLARVRGWLAAGLSKDAFGDARRLVMAEPWVEAHGGATLPVSRGTSRRGHHKRTSHVTKRSAGKGGRKGTNGARKQRSSR